MNCQTHEVAFHVLVQWSAPWSRSGRICGITVAGYALTARARVLARGLASVGAFGGRGPAAAAVRAARVTLHGRAFPEPLGTGITIALLFRILRRLVAPLHRRLVLVARAAPFRWRRRLPVRRRRPRLLRTAALARGPLLFGDLADR